jgi:4-hydroxy-tetrahydrodipicolinate reductase
MRILVLGQGKTGRLVADVAAEHGHSVHVLDAKENRDASGLTAPFVAGFDVVIDFTTPESAVQNMRACLATGAKMVIGTTGWYEKLADMRSLAERRGGTLLYGTNFSIGVQVMLQLAAIMASALQGAGYDFTISETHHATKMDTPSGTAVSLGEMLDLGGGVKHVEIESRREGEAMGLHVLEARSGADRLVLTHEAFSRRGFAEGAVRAAEWLVSQKPGSYDFREIYAKV